MSTYCLNQIQLKDLIRKIGRYYQKKFDLFLKSIPINNYQKCLELVPNKNYFQLLSSWRRPLFGKYCYFENQHFENFSIWKSLGTSVTVIWVNTYNFNWCNMYYFIQSITVCHDSPCIISLLSLSSTTLIPSWTLWMCDFSLCEELKILSHFSHLWFLLHSLVSYSKSTTLNFWQDFLSLCIFNNCAELKDLSHKSHLNFFKWIPSIWVLRFEVWLKYFSHQSHLYFFKPSWTDSTCCLSASAWLKDFSHLSHLNFLRPKKV